MGKLTAFCRLLLLLLTHFPSSKNAFLGVSWTMLGSAEYFNAQMIPLERKDMRLCLKKKAPKSKPAQYGHCPKTATKGAWEHCQIYIVDSGM
jgi:hypothetical protein